MAKKSMLWVSDAACQSGFAVCTHQVLETVRAHWDVSVLGVNYRGEPHRYPYDIYPAYLGGDPFGFKRVKELVDLLAPDLVVFQTDPWHIPRYLKDIPNTRAVGIIAVDGKNCRGKDLNGLQLAVFWTRFGEAEARKGGYTGPSAVIPLGVDLNVFKPMDIKEARKIAGLPDSFADKFIVGNVNRNQMRKRLDLSIEYFADWVKHFHRDDAYLYLHVAPTGDQGYDCEQLAEYYGVANRLILAEPDVFKGRSIEELVATYNSFDVQISTTQGEGWGLCAMEGMACQTPQIVPDWAALGEWTKGGAIQVPCFTKSVTPNFINSIGGVADKSNFIAGLERLYSEPSYRQEMADKALELVSQPEYDWGSIGDRYTMEFVERFYKSQLRIVANG